MSGRRSLLGTLAAMAAVPAVAAVAPEPDAQLVAIGREALPLLREYERLNDAWFAAAEGTPEVDIVGDASDRIYARLDALRDQAQGLTATSFLGAQAKAIFLRIDMLHECSRKGGMAFDGTAQRRLWEFLGELTEGGAA